MDKEQITNLLLFGCNQPTKKNPAHPRVDFIFERQMAVLLLHIGHKKARIGISMRFQENWFSSLQGITQLSMAQSLKRTMFKKTFCLIAKNVTPQDREQFINDFITV